MKKICILIILISGWMRTGAQEADTIPPYKKDPNLPAFLIQKTDSTWFSADSLPKYDYTAIIYFSPSCSHCQIMAKDIATYIDSLKQVFFVFVSYSPLTEIKSFAEYYGLTGIPNLRIGRDPRYHIPAFYRVQYTPFTAIYDKTHTLIKVYDPPTRNAAEAADLIRLVYERN